MTQRLLRHIIFILVLFFTVSSYGQQEPMFTQYMNNPQLINPAYTGSSGNLNFNGIFRKQWAGSGIDWAPTSTSLSVNSPFYDYKVGIGLDFMHDEIGPMTMTGIFTNYAYHLEFDDGRILSMGLKGGINFFQKDLQGLTMHEEDDWINRYPTTEKALVNFGVGAYYFADRYFMGASIPNLLRNSLVDAENTLEIKSRKEQHLFLTGGYVFDLNTLFKLKPTAMVRLVNGAPVSLELTATAIFVDKIWFGLMYRFGDAMAAHVRMEVRDGLHLGYSYDLTTSELRPHNSGTHEIYFSYTIKKSGRRILSPRYF